MWLAVLLVAWSLGSGAAFAQGLQTPARAAEQDLIDAAKLGQLPAATRVLAQTRAVDVTDARGFTPLLWASAGGYADLVRALLESGAKVNHRSTDGTTALMLASANGFDPVVRVLLAAGADVALKRGGATARDLAAERRHDAVVSQLDTFTDLATRLQQAVAEGHDSLVRQLMAQGVPADITDAQGVTLAMVAARNGDLGILQHLVSRGASLTARDAEGRTVIDWADRAPLTAPYVTAFVRDRAAESTAATLGPPSTRPTPATLQYDAPAITDSLQALAAALARVPASNGALRRLQRSTSATVDRLLKLSAAWPAQSPADYRTSVAALVTQLDGVLARGDPKLLSDALQALNEDLEAKLEHCVQSGGRLGGSVMVSVRTLRTGAEQTNWQVFYIPRMLEASPTASPDLFPQLSSPTRDTLVPGRYVMWVRNPASARVGERTIVKIGEGRKEMAVDLPVPADVP